MSFFQSPGLGNSPQRAAECPELAAGTLVSGGEPSTCAPRQPLKARPSPGPGVAAELVHVWVVLGQDGDGVALLPNDEAGLLLRGAPQVYAIELGDTQSGR